MNLGRNWESLKPLHIIVFVPVLRFLMLMNIVFGLKFSIKAGCLPPCQTIWPWSHSFLKGGYPTTEAWFVHLLQEKMQVPWRVFANSLAFMPVVRFRWSVHEHGAAHCRGTLQEAMESHHQAGLLRYLELAKSDGRYPPDNLSFGLKDDRSKIPNRPREELNLQTPCLSSMCCPEGWQLAKTTPYPDGNWVLGMGKLSLLVT